MIAALLLITGVMVLTSRTESVWHEANMFVSENGELIETI